MQVKKIIAYTLTVCLLISTMISPAYAVDEVYSITDDAANIPAPAIYYTPDYYPGVVAEMRSSGLYANAIAHGSYSEMNYNPSWFYLKGSTISSGDFNAITPEVIADQSDVSAVYSIPNTSLTNGDSLTFNLPNTEDGYFDFQSSNFLFDQQSAQANTFYINGTLTFNLRNLWSFTGVDGDLNTKNASWYLASDPLAVQLVIDGNAYGDIIDVTGYTSPFTALYNGGVPSNATVTFDNLKVYYQGDTPDMIGFRVYTGSKFTNGQYSYGDFTAVGVTNTVTFRCSSIPDITFVQEGGSDYAGDLSGIQGVLNSVLSAIQSGFSSLHSLMVDSSGGSWFGKLYDSFYITPAWSYVTGDGIVSSGGTKTFASLTNSFFVGITRLFRNAFLDSSGNTVFMDKSNLYLNRDGSVSTLSGAGAGITYIMSVGLQGLASLSRNAQSYVADTVFPWQSYNMETHQLNAATNITGQNNLFFTAFQSMEDKLGRLAYVFGSDEDLQLKDAADPGTDAFRENFGGGASLSDIGDAAELTTSVPKLMDSGFDFGDAIEEIGGNDDFLSWFTVETWAALDSTGKVVVADSGYLSDYYDNLRKVEQKRHWGD